MQPIGMIFVVDVVSLMKRSVILAHRLTNSAPNLFYHENSYLKNTQADYCYLCYSYWAVVCLSAMYPEAAGEIIPC